MRINWRTTSTPIVISLRAHAQTLASESGSKVSGEANAHIAHARIGTARRARANNYVRRVTIHGRPGTAREPVTGEH